MSKVDELKKAIRALPHEEALELVRWLSEHLEDSADLTQEFVASIERGKSDIRQGRARINER